MRLYEISTGSHSWQVVAEDQQQAERALLAAYEAHASTNPYADPRLMQHFLDLGDVLTVTPLTPNVVLRDREPFITI